jgi:hypothetical protein
MTHAGDSLMSMPMDDARARRRPEAQPEQIREAVARLVAERVAQGFPPKVTDPVVLARIAAILRSTDTPRARTQPGSKQQQQQQQATGRARRCLSESQNVFGWDTRFRRLIPIHGCDCEAAQFAGLDQFLDPVATQTQVLGGVVDRQ